MYELVIISGKGGTGKTSVTACFAVMADRPVIADCDVDAADLHLLLTPIPRTRQDFLSGHEAVIQTASCTGCGLCKSYCRFNAIVMTNSPDGVLRYSVDPVACEGCGVCLRFCPAGAIGFPERLCGEWMLSDTRCGPMVHARLGIAAENSGKLVSTVRRETRQVAQQGNHSIILVDGPPGIGCPVIASVTGASQVLVVSEPTLSGEHDLERVLSLTRHFGIPSAVTVNKWDLNPSMTHRIEDRARQAGAAVAPRIRYDRSVTRAQMNQRTIVEISDTGSAQDIRAVWAFLQTSTLGAPRHESPTRSAHHNT